ALKRGNVKPAAGERVHVIARGDTLSDIALRYNISLRVLRRHNSLSSSTIRIGQKIQIPAS
ncbi:MAG: LysM peptidoglycan-binding domain-containing protein, partial [Spongiibacteraceae bacterium]